MELCMGYGLHEYSMECGLPERCLWSVGGGADFEDLWTVIGCASSPGQRAMDDIRCSADSLHKSGCADSPRQ